MQLVLSCLAMKLWLRWLWPKRQSATLPWKSSGIVSLQLLPNAADAAEALTLPALSLRILRKQCRSASLRILWSHTRSLQHFVSATVCPLTKCLIRRSAHFTGPSCSISRATLQKLSSRVLVELNKAAIDCIRKTSGLTSLRFMPTHQALALHGCSRSVSEAKSLLSAAFDVAAAAAAAVPDISASFSTLNAAQCSGSPIAPRFCFQKTTLVQNVRPVLAL